MKDLFGDEPVAYPERPGWREPITSKEAAEAIADAAETLRAQVLAVLGRAPSTVHETAEQLDLPVPSVQPRFSELRKMAKIEPTGEKRKNKTGKKAHVWRAIRRSKEGR